MDELWVDPIGAGRAALARTRESALQPALPPSLVAAAGDLDLDESDLALGIELARFAPADLREPILYLVTALRAAERLGSTRVRLVGDELFDALGFSLSARQFAESLEGHLGKLHPLFSGDGDAPLVAHGGYLYSGRSFARERRVAAALQTRLREPAADSLGDSLDKADSHLTSEQRAAVHAATTRRLALVSGGPGTGKTSIVVAMIRRFLAAGMTSDDIALAAPTGRAADRMLRSVQRGGIAAELKAQTLHRLLGYSMAIRGFRHHENNPVRASVVIVDESSMVDLAMFDSLLRALSPDTALVLLGDADQLPSVEAGAVFRDLCEHLKDAEALTKLTRSFRMDTNDPDGSEVYELAQGANAGGPVTIAPRQEVSDVRFAGAELLPLEEREAFLERWWSLVAPEPRFALRTYVTPFSDADLKVLEKGFAAADASRLLALTHSSLCGTIALNDAMHKRAQPNGQRSWAQGEPVMMKRNDYELGLFNGDQGILLRVAGKRSVVFRAGASFRIFPLQLVAPQLELAWCTTVHKAQGSEFDRIALVLPAESSLGTREIIYTAVTRARRGALIVAGASALERMLAKRIARESGLQSRLA
ncbi:MAG: exodeoxyribonuclease V alpha subunit [Polyangiales bacterium]|jgi:exodeoxyribonuclease V alpha subunit